MLEFHEAQRRLLALAEPLGAERLDLRAARGRVLAESIRSAVALPPFDNSAMDGYAVRFDDLSADPVGTSLPVAGESRAGASGPPLLPGTAQRIFTGAPLPAGADTVIIQENVERQGETIRLRFAAERGEHVRRKGEDVSVGEMVLPRGTRLGPFHLSLLASLEHLTVAVARAPRVSILCTGDELRLPGLPALGAPSGSLPESNGIALAALCESAGASVTLLPIGRDDSSSLTLLLRDALRSSDVVVTVGGVSVGDYDLVQSALSSVGVRSEFYKVRIRPGKPLAVGRFHSTLTLGLPGNPVSAQVTGALFLVPLLRTLQGDQRPVAPFVRRRLEADFAQKPGRRGFFRGVVEGDAVTVHDKQSSGSVASMAQANALVTFSEDSLGAKAGEYVDTLLLSDL